MSVRLYRTDAGQWCTTSAEADAAAKVQEGATADGNGRWSAVDVPTDPAGLAAFLNQSPQPGAVREPHTSIAGTAPKDRT